MDPIDTASQDFISVPFINFESLFSWLAEIVTAIWPFVLTFIKNTAGFIIGASFIVSIMFIIGIIYCVEQLKAIRQKETEKYDIKVEPMAETAPAGSKELAERWQSVLVHVSSASANDWRQAILDADIILDDILTRMEYRGESVGEKLKRAERGDFRTLDEAWEAHKVRNQVAHEGSAMDLDQREALRVVNLYKKVFEEFYYV